MAVRDAARRLHIVPVGSLGIVVSAFKREEITLQEGEAEQARLYISSTSRRSGSTRSWRTISKSLDEISHLGYMCYMPYLTRRCINENPNYDKG